MKPKGNATANWEFLIELLILILKHIGMVALCYSGFVRFLSNDNVAKMPIVFGHTFEIFAQNVPLMVI